MTYNDNLVNTNATFVSTSSTNGTMMMRIQCKILTLSAGFLIYVHFIQICCGVTVDTKYGPVVGQRHDLHDGTSVNSFLGIPYAKAPTLALRWQPPQEPDPWEEPFVADQLGMACPQVTTGMIWLTHPGWMRYGEDCLNLNVYAPADDINGPYPTMVWIHGGIYKWGSNIQHPGYFLAAKDVVVVIINYRLGILGFATTEDEVAPGNYGMLDQNHALIWVQENIEAFGGNPDEVTLFGESAGSYSVGLHMMSPMSTGLFRNGILQSGAEIGGTAYTRAHASPSNWTRGMAEQLDCPTEDNQAMMNCLRTHTPTALRQAHGNCSTCRDFKPVVDGEGGFLPDTPENLRETGEFNQVPEIIGLNSEDSFFFFAGGFPGTGGDGFNRTEFEDILKGATHKVSDPDLQERVDEAYLFYYSPWPHLDDHEKNRDNLGYLWTDDDLGWTTDEQTRSHMYHAPTYQYVLSYFSPAYSVLFAEWLGSCHMMDLPFVFGFPYFDMNRSTRNESKIIPMFPWTDEDVEYSELIMNLWTNFAKYNNPTPEPVDGPSGQEVEWLAYIPAEHNYMSIDFNFTGTRQNYRSHEFSFGNYYLRNMLVDEDGTTKLLHDSASRTHTIMDEMAMEEVFDRMVSTVFEVAMERDYPMDYFV